MPGRVLSFDSVFGEVLTGNLVAGSAFGPDGAPAVPGLADGLIKALCGIGCFPCWISKAFCLTEGGGWICEPVPAGVTPPCPGPPFAAGDDTPGWLGDPGATGAPAAGWAGWLMTVLMTVVLWILAKMMLFGGGAT
jgi:hypothetical protein